MVRRAPHCSELVDGHCCYGFACDLDVVEVEVAVEVVVEVDLGILVGSGVEMGLDLPA